MVAEYEEYKIEPKLQTSTDGGGDSNWTKWLVAPEEDPDPENLGRRIRSLTRQEAEKLVEFIKSEYKIF